MEWHRDDGVRIIEDFCPGRAHHRGERISQPAPTLVLERSENPPERLFVVAGRSRGVNSAAMAAAPGTLFEGDADDAPGGQSVAAGAAQGSCQDAYLAPARRADGPRQRRVQHGGTRGAPRGERDGQQGVYSVSAHS